MAILKNDARVLGVDSDSSPGSCGTASAQDDDEEPSAWSAKAESCALDSSDADSGMESDELDPVELGEAGTQLCQVGNQSCSIPLEFYDLPDLGAVLSLETWNECLSENERFALAEHLPDMDLEMFGRTLKELFAGENFHFGSPLATFLNRLKGGLCDPRIVLYRQGLSFLQHRDHYHHLCKYQNSLVRRLVGIRDAWQNCGRYAIEERLQLLNIVRSRRPLRFEANGKPGYEKDSDSGDSDEWYLNKQFKIGQQFVKPSFDITPYDIGMARGPVKFGKEYSKGVLKVAASKASAQEYVGVSGSYTSALNNGVNSKTGVGMPLLALPQQDKFTVYDVGSAIRTRRRPSGDRDDNKDGYAGLQVDWSALHKSTKARSSLLKTGKKQGPQRKYDIGMWSDEDPDGYNDASQSHEERRSAGQVVTVASYGDELPEHTKATYFEKGWGYSETGRAQNYKPTTPLQQNKMHEEAISLGLPAKKSDKVRKESKTGKYGTSYDFKNKSYKPAPTEMSGSHLHKDSRANILQGRMKTNMTQYEGMGGYSMGNTMISESEETESDSSDRVEDDIYISPVRNVELQSGDDRGHHDGAARSSYGSRKPKKFMKLDSKGHSNFTDVGRSIDSQDLEAYAMKGSHGGLVKKAIVPQPSEKFTHDGKKHKGMVDMDHLPQLSFYVHDYGSSVMDEYMENLDSISKLQGGKNMIHRLGNMMEASDDVQTVEVTQERSSMLLVGCNSLSRRPKRNVDGHYFNEQDEPQLLHSPEQQTDDLHVIRKGKKKTVAEIDTSAIVNPDMVIWEQDTGDGEPKAKLHKKPFTLITPTIHTGFSFSIIHLLSAVRKAMITPYMPDPMLITNHLQEKDNRPKQISEDQNRMHQGANGTHLSHSMENMEKHSVEQNSLPCLTVQEVVDQVRSNPGDPYILETQEPLQELVRGVLKIFSSKTAPLGAKGWKPLVSYERSNKSWSWAGPVASSSSDNDNAEEETSSEAWGIPHKMLVKLVDAFANWLKSGQVTLQQIGSLPPPPTSLLLNLDEKERFKDLRAQKSLNTISSSSGEVRSYFQREEFLRYSVPDRAFSYTAADGKKSIVAPLRKGGGKPTSKARDHFMLKPDRPPHVTILCLVRDAAARLPGGIGTRADVCTLLRDSQYIVENVSDLQMNQVVSGALDRLHYERDPCVQYDSERKLWVYLHRDREEEDFEDDGTSSTKKWKRQRKDSLDQSDIAVLEVDMGVMTVDGSSAGLDHDLNVDSSPNQAEEKCELVYEDVGSNMVNSDSLMDSTTVRKSHGNWEGLGLNPLRESRLVCQENSTDEDFDDETFSQARPVHLHYDLIMKNGL